MGDHASRLSFSWTDIHFMHKIDSSLHCYSPSAQHIIYNIRNTGEKLDKFHVLDALYSFGRHTSNSCDIHTMGLT